MVAFLETIQTTQSIRIQKSDQLPICYEILSGKTNQLVGHFENFLSSDHLKSMLQSSDSEKAKHYSNLIDRLFTGEDLLSELERKIRFIIIVQLESTIKNCLKKMDASNRNSKFQNLINQFDLIPFGSEASGMNNPISNK